ncbi:MAG: hypothetical protein M1826_000171 [Phylliscum demangeonii]|nr:MAG: hypothetical protein M1826_000171 [Phylliscum demangeonii]
MPALWHPPPSAPTIRPDTGRFYVDENMDRNPWSPLEPLVAAVCKTDPTFDFKAMDLITDRTPLRKLYDFVMGTAEAFRFGAETIDRTVLFVRMERETRVGTTKNIGVGESYRRGFEERYTRFHKHAAGSTTHHRIMRYRYGGLRLLVRSAVDGYLEEETTGGGRKDEQDYERDFVGIMRARSLSHPAPSVAKTPVRPGVKIAQGRADVPHRALFELNTRPVNSEHPFKLQLRLPDLWLSQTANFIDAAYLPTGVRAMRPDPRRVHFRRGQLTITPMQAELVRWQESHAADLGRLRDVVVQVRDAVRGVGAPCLVEYVKDEDALRVRRDEEGLVPLLPPDLRQRWTGAADANEGLLEPAETAPTRTDSSLSEASSDQESIAPVLPPDLHQRGTGAADATEGLLEPAETAPTRRDSSLSEASSDLEAIAPVLPPDLHQTGTAAADAPEDVAPAPTATSNVSEDSSGPETKQ